MQHNEQEQSAPHQAAETAVPATEISPDELRTQLEEERQKAQSYFGQWQRAVADFQNFKRRTEEQRAENRREANAAAVINMLPALDDLGRALDTLDVKLAGLSWTEGIRQIQRKLEGSIQAMGGTEIRAEGEDFDPKFHEAVSPIAGEEGKVIRVLQKGYMLGDRVVRPALVMVGNGEE